MVDRVPTAVKLLLVVFVAYAIGGCYSPTLPLPPPARGEISVSPPDVDGFVEIIGEPGVIDVGEQAVILNTRTLYGWIVPVSEDGFTALVEAEVDDVLSIQRRVGDEVSQSIDVIVPSE